MTRLNHPTMTDERLDRLLRQILAERAEDVAATAVSADAMAELISIGQRPVVIGRRWVLLAAAAMLTALVIGSALAVGGAVPLPWLQLPAPLPSAAPDDEVVAPLRSPTPDSEVVHGWPDTTENEAGVYSWHGGACGMSCIMGFMHNGYGAGNVQIQIEALGDRAIPDDVATAVTVAGHDAIYRRIDAFEEEWIVDIDGTTIAIHLMAEPDAGEAELAEAHAIVDSMRTEPQENRLGFRLIFSITTNDWDSG